jgi:H+-transporting ATPase
MRPPRLALPRSLSHARSPTLARLHPAESRRIFKRLKAYVIYRICVTVQVVAFLCIVSFLYNEAFDALYIILLALFHDLTIVTIAYDHQTPSPTPEHPTVLMLIVVAYSMGFVLAASSVVMYAYGENFLSESFATNFKYKESALFLQISHSSAILIFAARTAGFSFLSRPAFELFMSAVVSQARAPHCPPPPSHTFSLSRLLLCLSVYASAYNLSV